MLCIAVKGPSIQEIESQTARALEHASLIEWRLDLFDSIDLDSLRGVLTATPVPVVFTFRGMSEHAIEELLTLQPAYIDLDYTVPKEFIRQVQVKYPKLQIIRSYHDFQKTPDDLQEIVDELTSIPVDFYKLACMANSSLDTFRMVEFSKSSKCLCMTMGPTGHLSRIVAPIHGQPWTYTCLDEATQVAPGQIAAKDLVSIYSYNRLRQATGLYGLIGEVVDRSMGHISHNEVMRQDSRDGLYIKMPIRPDELDQAMEHIKKLGFKGLSVTTSLKERIMQYCTYLTPSAEAIGAVNTLTIKDGKLYGSNTDAPGALNALEDHVRVAGKKVVVIGAGGAAKAICWEAIRRGAKVTVCNRSKERATELAISLGCMGKGLDEVPSDYDIIINATSVDMPIDPAYIIPGAIAMDIRSRPKDTAFLQEAAKRSCHIVYGYEMYIKQAVLQFTTWFTDIDPTKVERILTKSVLALV